MFAQPEEDPEPPTLHCGYSQVGATNSAKFNFYTTYRDNNADEPDYVKLYLVAPNGTEINYLMTANTEISEENLIQNGVEYNKTIDFENLGNRTGQWFYYFTAKEDSEQEYCVKYPNDHYCEPGPFFDVKRTPEKSFPYLLYSSINQYFGSENDDFNFTVVGGDFVDNKMPQNVSLNVLWNNGTIQSFLMDEADAYMFEVGVNSTARNITLTTYEISLNFDPYINVDEDGTFVVRSYYSAEFTDGNVSTLFNYHNNTEDEFVKTWFDDPTIVGQGSAPQIIGWNVEELTIERHYLETDPITNSIRELFVPIGPVCDEDIVRFMVFVYDPDGDHRYHYDEFEYVFEPELIFTNLDDPDNSLEPIKMAWAGKGHDPYPDVDAYFVDILPFGAYTYDYEDFYSFDFSPGMWTFNFSVTDFTDNTVNEMAKNLGRAKKLWYIGSTSQMWNTMINGYDGIGNLISNGLSIDFNLPFGAGIIQSIGVTIAYMVAGGLTMLGKRGRMAGRIVATGIAGYDLLNTALAIYDLFNIGDTGALLGLALSSIISVVGLAIVHIISTTKAKTFFDLDKGKIAKYKSFNGRGLEKLGNFAKIIFLIQLIFVFITNPRSLVSIPGGLGENEEAWNWIEKNWMDPEARETLANLGKLPMEILGLIFSTIALGSILNIASMKDKNLLDLENEKNCINTKGNLFKELPFSNQPNPVIKIAKIHIYIKCFLTVASFVTFMVKSGMYHLAGDYLLLTNQFSEQDSNENNNE
ncbi:MAG: hypothetical protein ACFFAN_11740 [Promethearchaeota archaeon]